VSCFRRGVCAKYKMIRRGALAALAVICLPHARVAQAQVGALRAVEQAAKLLRPASGCAQLSPALKALRWIPDTRTGVVTATGAVVPAQSAEVSLLMGQVASAAPLTRAATEATHPTGLLEAIDAAALSRTQSAILAELEAIPVTPGPLMRWPRTAAVWGHVHTPHRWTPPPATVRTVPDSESTSREIAYWLPRNADGDVVPGRFVVVAAGYSTDATNLWMQQQAFGLLKEGWGVIYVENVTSAPWLARNHKIAPTGYEAGWYLYETLRSIRNDPELGPMIAELHGLGISLGGNDLAFAAYFDSTLNSGARLIDGAIANISSPADRYASFLGLRQLGKFADRQLIRTATRSIHAGVREGLSEVVEGLTYQDMFFNEPDAVIETAYLPQTRHFLAGHQEHFHREGTGPSLLRVSERPDIGRDEFQEMFSLAPYISSIRVPTLWIHAEDDFMMFYRHTRGFLTAHPTPETALLSAPYGGHVGFQAAHGVLWQDRVLRTYFDYWSRPTAPR